MKILKGYFYVNVGYVNAVRREDFEIIVQDDESGDSQLEDLFQDFLANIDMGWVINEGDE